LSRGSDLRARRDAGKVEELHRDQRATLRQVASGFRRTTVQPPGGSALMMRWTLRFALCTAAVLAVTLVIRAADASDAELQFQLGNLLSDETRFRGALDAFDKAIQTDEHALQVRAGGGKGETAPRIAAVDWAQQDGE